MRLIRTKEVICVLCKKREIKPLSRARTYKYCSMLCMKKGYSSILPIKGDRINNWIIQDEFLHRKNGRSYVPVKCSCGSNISLLIPKSHLVSKKHNGCEMCSMFHTSKGFNLISGEYWSLIQNAAKKRGITFNLSIEQAWDVFLKQYGKCALTGIDLFFEGNTTRLNRKRVIRKTASLDRIDSKLPYVIENIQWLHKDVNIMKNKYKQDYFIEICKKIAQKN